MSDISAYYLILFIISALVFILNCVAIGFVATDTNTQVNHTVIQLTEAGIGSAICLAFISAVYSFPHIRIKTKN